jgi:hypothetical protein
MVHLALSSMQAKYGLERLNVMQELLSSLSNIQPQTNIPVVAPFQM